MLTPDQMARLGPHCPECHSPSDWRELVTAGSDAIRRMRKLKDALAATNEEIIRYGMNSEDYDWGLMTARTRENARMLR